MEIKRKSVVSCVSIVDDTILVQQHVKLNTLQVPGGKVEDGEYVVEAFYREMSEELGLSKDDIKIVSRGLYTHKDENDEEFTEWRFHVEPITEWTNREPHAHSEIGYKPIEEVMGTSTSLIVQSIFENY